jgi:hypothetical protein
LDTKPDYELLHTAYTVIGGIPPQAISLDWTRNKRGPSLSDGTVYHPACWLAQHPRFAELGLALSDNGKHLLFRGQAGSSGAYSEPLAQLFDLPLSDILGLFAERGARMGESLPTLTDKDVWMQRVESYLAAHAPHRAREGAE